MPTGKYERTFHQFCKRGHDRTLPGALTQYGVCRECRKLRKNDPELQRNWNLKRIYGIDWEFYEYLLVQQDGKCAICGSPPSGGKGKKLHVDHDHNTGRVRALLCTKCNVGIGMFADDPDRLLKAAAYLKNIK